MKKVLRVYGGVLRLVRLLPADTRPYYAKYARENFVNYREVDVSETPSTNSINELTITLWVLKRYIDSELTIYVSRYPLCSLAALNRLQYSIDESAAKKMKEICFE
ncbi:hypothetical protein Bca52824_086371 [Brassica carinata]|uniref:Uncharacterized protein n=1 Tax=Brassica carinata TaxID=52824 RepID=A0A8X7PA34_BRACI|nr:hypothetical protein Bca52824_086371 [Brassica carinata]